MSLKRLARLAFDIMAWGVLVTMFCLLVLGIGSAVLGDELETVQIAPAAVQIDADVVEPAPVATEVKEPDVVVLSCTVIRKDDTEEFEPVHYSDADLENLALVIYQEAGSDVCSDETRLMVGNVVLNRVADERFPDTIEEVLLQERQYGMLHWTGLVWPERASYSTEAHAVQRAYDCAERLLNGERVFAEDVIWQAEFSQGSEIVAQQDGFYFCRG